jgi:hypothetical protein
MIEMILNIYYLLNIVIPYIDWSKFVSHVKNLIIIISQMDFLGEWTYICDKLNFLQMWGGPFFKIPIQSFFG